MHSKRFTLKASKPPVTFEEHLERRKPWINEALLRFRDKRASWRVNEHNARIALWLALNSGVEPRKVRGRFFQEFKKAKRTDEIGISKLERGALRLDNRANVNWHEVIPDRRHSLNLHKMGNPYYLKKELRSDPWVLEKESKKRAKKRRKARLKEKYAEESRKSVIEFEKRMERSRVRIQFVFGLINKVTQASLKNPYLFKPSQILDILSIQAIGVGGHIGVLRPRPSQLSLLRKLMGRVEPVNAAEVGYYKNKPLQKEKKEIIIATIKILGRFYPKDFLYAHKYLDALAFKVSREGKMPDEVRLDLEKHFKKLENKYPLMFEGQEGEQTYDEPY